MNEEIYAIQVNNLSKKYKIGKKLYKEIFNDFSIKFEKGKVHCILGASGYGKSSLLRIIAGLEEFEKGKITFNENIIKSTNIPLIMILQENNLLPWLTVTQNIKFVLYAVKKELPEEEINSILKKYDIYEIKNFYPHELSVGLKQKVTLAKSIITNPKIVLLDEAFCALDFISKENIHKIFLKEFAIEEFTSVLSTHYVEEAIELGDYIHLLGKNNKYEKIENSLQKPRKQDRNYNEFLEYVKSKYIY